MATKRTSRRTAKGERTDASIRVLMLSLADWFDDPSPARGKVVAADLRALDAMVRPSGESRGHGAPPLNFPDCCPHHRNHGAVDDCCNPKGATECFCDRCVAIAARSSSYPHCCSFHVHGGSQASGCCNGPPGNICECSVCEATPIRVAARGAA